MGGDGFFTPQEAEAFHDGLLHIWLAQSEDSAIPYKMETIGARTTTKAV